MPEGIERINDQDSHEQVEEDSLNRQIGARALTATGFENHQKEIVDSSFNKARKQGEKLPGKNNERRNYAYLSRLEKLIDKYGNGLEKKLWESSVNNMIVKPENITDGYWRTQEQILRDNGQGRELSDQEKTILTEDIQKQQRESLESWSNYLGDKNSPYPLWFKVYAWDGMTKMGVFDKEKGYFKKRDEHTVAPYPKLNPAVLAKTYGVVADFYGIKDKERYTENRERNEILEALAASGNFNKLYSKILLSEKAIPKTPEKTEDIQGEWVEYLPGDEEKLASAAEGTPWCVADPGTGRNYLEYGNYAGDEDDDEDDYDDYRYADDDEYHDNQAKFILFHLYDPEKNMLSESACASIRLNPEGRVAEISGLNEGQALEDSLVPIVEEKVKTLPGGEDFLEAFADKQELIRLDRKMQNDEDLTREELEFVYELNRPIKTLDTYNDEDPRIFELKMAYTISYAIDAGVNANKLAPKVFFNRYAINSEVDTLIKHGVDINSLIDSLSSDDISDNLLVLLDNGGDVNKIANKLRVIYDTDLRTLLEHGANVDQLVSKLDRPYSIVHNLDVLNSYGVDIDIKRLVSKMSSFDITRSLSTLLNHGVDANQLVSELDPWDIVNYLDTLLNHGADIGKIASALSPGQIAENIDILRAHGYQG